MKQMQPEPKIGTTVAEDQNLLQLKHRPHQLRFTYSNPEFSRIHDSEGDTVAFGKAIVQKQYHTTTGGGQIQSTRN